jgi:hypothetical protein
MDLTAKNLDRYLPLHSLHCSLPAGGVVLFFQPVAG